MRDQLGDLANGKKFESKFEQVFMEIDIDGSGTIEKDEMLLMLRNLMVGGESSNQAKKKTDK